MSTDETTEQEAIRRLREIESELRSLSTRFSGRAAVADKLDCAVSDVDEAANALERDAETRA